jgi:hypothetical protein
MYLSILGRFHYNETNKEISSIKFWEGMKSRNFKIEYQKLGEVPRNMISYADHDCTASLRSWFVLTSFPVSSGNIFHWIRGKPQVAQHQTFGWKVVWW